MLYTRDESTANQKQGEGHFYIKEAVVASVKAFRSCLKSGHPKATTWV